MGFDRQNHIILGAEFGRPVGRRQIIAPNRAVDVEAEALLADRRQMRPAGDQADLGAGVG